MIPKRLGYAVSLLVVIPMAMAAQLAREHDPVILKHWSAPLYWQRAGEGWSEFTLGGNLPLDLDAPVGHLSYYEADAYARWAGGRLPTEAEWETSAASLPAEGNLLESGALAPRPPGPSTARRYARTSSSEGRARAPRRGRGCRGPNAS